MAGNQPGSDKKVGAASEPCPLKKCSILVQVLRADTGAAIGGAEVAIRGPKSDKKTSSATSGTALFDPVQPGAYAVTASLPAALAKEFETAQSASATAFRGGETVVIIRVIPMAKLKVKVVYLDSGSAGAPETLIANASVEINERAGARQQKTMPSDGIADFGAVKAGEYSIGTTLQEADRKKYRTPIGKLASLSPGENKLVVVQLESIEFCWIEIDLQEEDESPLAESMPYSLKLADGTTREGTIEKGYLRLDKIPCGTCLLRLPGVDGSDYVVPADADVGAKDPPHWIEIQVQDDGKGPVPEAAYWIKLTDGTVKEGKLDKNGMARFEAIAPGICEFKLPEFDAGDLELVEEAASPDPSPAHS
jgi:hypothetical protein